MKKRITSLLLTLVMVLAMLPASLTTTAEAYLPTPNPNTPHSNNGWVELNGPLGVAALKEYLKDENNTWYMRLTGNISLDDDSFNGITVKGTKYLDLNVRGAGRLHHRGLRLPRRRQNPLRRIPGHGSELQQRRWSGQV